MSEPAVIVIAKAPVAGRVKTRCCPPCTPEQAARLAEAALIDTLDAGRATRAARRVIALDGAPGPWLGAGYEVIAQRGDGLGARIDNAFADVGGPALLIGMDTPQLDAAAIDRALATLEAGRVDALVGPAADGGFWALGLLAPIDGLCATVGMSTASTGAQLRTALHRRGLGRLDLEVLVDVDDFSTAMSVAAEVPGSRFAVAVSDVMLSIATLRAVG